MRGDGYYGYSTFDTQTINMLLSYRPTASDKITVKAIDNELDTELPIRMSLKQFRHNPFQKGCETAVGAAPGCVTNGFSATNLDFALALDFGFSVAWPRRSVQVLAER